MVRMSTHAAQAVVVRMERGLERVMRIASRDWLSMPAADHILRFAKSRVNIELLYAGLESSLAETILDCSRAGRAMMRAS